MARVKRLAAIHDLSGYGRCSLTTAIAILSAQGHQVCPVPTAVFSKHTGFKSFFCHDLTDCLSDYLADWEDLEFDGIYSGFLGKAEQIKIVEAFIRSRNGAPLIFIDPVMGDSGRIYATYTTEMCSEMRRLVALATVITPNLTEAAILTDTDYEGEEIPLEKAENLARKLLQLGSDSVVITGIREDDALCNLALEASGNCFVEKMPRTAAVFSGTGDIFASVTCGELMAGKSLQCAVRRAGEFVCSATTATLTGGGDLAEGVQFEPLLSELLLG